MHDLRYAWRQLRRSPAFTAVALLTLALCIGANTALFSLMDAALLKRLPVARPEQLVSVAVTTPAGAWMTNVPSVLFEELRRAPRSFSGVFGFWQQNATIRWNGDAERALVQHVSGDYYGTLGVRPFAGRLITPGDDTPDGGDVAVLGYDFWVRRFGADPAVLGELLVVDGTARTIVGVTPRGFFGTDRVASPDVTVPLGDPRKLANVWLMARLGDNASAEQARAETEVAWQRATEILRPAFSRYRASERDEMLARGVRLMPGDRAGGRLGMREHADRLRLLMLLSAVVLLIGCANLANLQLARASARSFEIGTRLAIGGGRWRIARLLLVESLLLSTLGGALGLVFAFWAHRALVTLMIGDAVPAGVAFALDYRLLTFAAAVSLSTTLLCGVAPALRVARVELVEVLRRDARVPGSRAGKGFVLAQVAACVVLLTSGILLARTLANLRAVDRGFSADGLLLVTVGPGDHARAGAAVAAFYEDLIARAGSVPGVLAASVAADALFGSGGWKKSIWAQSRPAEERQSAQFNSVAPRFFSTVGMPLVAGRDFTSHDRFDTSHVVIVNEAFARRYCQPGGWIGCRFGDSAAATGKYEVVGIVKDARHASLRRAPEPTFYEALLQEDRPSTVTLHLRMTGGPGAIASRTRDELRRHDASLAVYGVRTIATQIDQSLRQDRMMATLSGFFALLALFLTCIGLFGTVAYGVERRMREIGIRVALGARRAHVLRVVSGDALSLVGAGAAIGVLLAFASTRVLARVLFGISPTDAVTVVCVVVLLTGTAALACYLPARRATALDPMAVLRRE